ncbi:hypothetical protein FOXYSP1_11633 [Fusarium oxysporum f. sp. phaseoli]
MIIRIGQLGDFLTLAIITHENGTATPARRARSGNGQSIHYRLYDARVCPAGDFALIANKAGNPAWVVRSKGYDQYKLHDDVPLNYRRYRVA